MSYGRFVTQLPDGVTLPKPVSFSAKTHGLNPDPVGHPDVYVLSAATHKIYATKLSIVLLSQFSLSFPHSFSLSLSVCVSFSQLATVTHERAGSRQQAS